MVQARSTERRWSRALQHEHSLRLQLQENLETLANQMHGLEDEARLSVQGVAHSLASQSGLASPLSLDRTGPSYLQKNSKTSQMESTTRDSPKEFTEEADGSVDADADDDDDKFFDAPEMSAEDWEKTSTSTEVVPTPAVTAEEKLTLGHRRSVSTVSVNDTSAMKASSETNLKEQLPQIPTDRKMSVSTDTLTSLFCFSYYWFALFNRYPLALLKTFSVFVLSTQSIAPPYFLSLVINLIYGLL